MARAKGVTLARVCEVLERLAPIVGAQSWDNVGLLAGDRGAAVTRVLVCIDLMPAVVDEAIELGADLAIAYHPPIFRPLTRLVAPSAEMDAGIVRCLGAGIAVYSPHSALDAAVGGTNDTLIQLCGVIRPAPLAVGEEAPVGRIGTLPRAIALGALAEALMASTGAACVSLVGSAAAVVQRVVVVVGAAGSLPFEAPIGLGRGDAIVTGEIRHHDALAIERRGATAIALSHWSSERPGVEAYARRVGKALPRVRVRVSDRDAEPFRRA